MVRSVDISFSTHDSPVTTPTCSKCKSRTLGTSSCVPIEWRSEESVPKNLAKITVFNYLRLTNPPVFSKDLGRKPFPQVSLHL